MRRPARPTGAQVAITVALVALAWSWLALRYFGALGEIAAVAAPLGVVGVLLAHALSLLLRRRAIVAISMVAWLVSATVMIASPRMPTRFATPRRPFLLVAANLRFDNPFPSEAANTVVARHGDVVVLSEGTEPSEAVVAAAYPYHRQSRYEGKNYSEFVASRYPLRPLAVPRELHQAVVVEVMAPTPFVLVAVHLPRAGIDLPHFHGEVSFAGQRHAIDAVTRLTNAAQLPVVVAGDFNVSDRTFAYHRLVTHRRDAMRARFAGSTYDYFPWNLLVLRIDHVTIDRSWCAARPARFHPTGSDHQAVQVEIGACS